MLTHLYRRVGFWDAVAIIVGNIVGIGIFLTPASVARSSEHPLLFILVWLLGGAIALAGGMSSAELGVSMPHAGGDYVFLRRSYGMPWAFLYGYLSFLFSFTGSIAVYATGVVQYQGTSLFGDVMKSLICILPLVDVPIHVYQLIAIIIIFFLTWLNTRHLGNSLKVQRLLTYVPVFFLLIVATIILSKALFISGEEKKLLWEHLTTPQNPSPLRIAPSLLPVFFTFTGWNVVLYLAEDMKDPHQVIPRSMFTGIITVSILYLLVCLALLTTIPFSELSAPDTGDVIARALQHVLGPLAGNIVSLLIFLLILGSINTTIMAGSRIYLAMARDKIFPAAAGHLHPRFGTPSWALWAQALWALVWIILIPDIEAMLNLTTLVMLLLSFLTISSVFVLRYKRSVGEERASYKHNLLYKALGYPWFPAFYLLAVAFIFTGTLLFDDSGFKQGLFALGAVLSGLLLYTVWKKGFKR